MGIFAAVAHRVRSLPAKGAGLIMVAAAAFLGGYELAGGDLDASSTTFSDMRVIPVESMTSLVDAEEPSVRELAQRLGSPERAYLHVRDSLAYDSSLPLASPEATLAAGEGSCLSKAALLASLYRALGVSDDRVRVVTGQARTKDGPMEHAWVELDHEGRSLQQDPTTLLGKFGFAEFEGVRYTRTFIRRELFCFNDRGFAVVSLGNRFRGGVDPHLEPGAAAVPESLTP